MLTSGMIVSDRQMFDRDRPPPTRRRVGAAERLLVLLSAALAVVTVLPANGAFAASEEPWEFDGGGWGHGVGLSQFGALGMAEEGDSVEEILDFYYSADAYLGELPGTHWTTETEGLKIGLQQSVTTIDIEAIGGNIEICQPAADCSDVSETIEPGELWRFEVNGSDPSECRFREIGVGNTGYHACDARLTKAASTGIRFDIDDVEYARGAIEFVPATDSFHAIVRIDLEQYLYGLAEVPSSWHPTALQVQAVIGRTFAVATAVARGGSDGSGVLSSCGCHLRDTASDQVYAGWSQEAPAWNGAVDDTAGDVLKHPESWLTLDLVETFYSSSNGGASENNEDVWPGTPRPWLRSVVDPYSSDPNINPLANWKILVTDEDMATALGWDRALDAFVLEGPPGLQVRFTGKDGGADVETLLNGTEIASILKTYGVESGGGQVRVSPYISQVIDPPGFDDIVGHLFEADIEWLLAEEITQGCNPPANTQFCPEDSVSREVMAAFLNRYLDLPAASQDYFTDDDNSIFEDDINRLAEAGITTGCGGTNFCPKNVVDRGQMAAFLVRALGLTDNGGGDLFIDDDNSIFENDIDRLGTAGITKGCNPPTNDRYCPDLPVSRGAMAAFLHRADDL